MINCLLMIVVKIGFCSSCRHTNELDELNSPSNTGNLSIAVVCYTLCLSVVILKLWWAILGLSLHRLWCYSKRLIRNNNKLWCWERNWSSTYDFVHSKKRNRLTEPDPRRLDKISTVDWQCILTYVHQLHILLLWQKFDVKTHNIQSTISIRLIWNVEAQNIINFIKETPFY